MSGTPLRFGQYELVERLGAGGMAETFIGVRRGPGGFEQRVCIKRILPTFERDAAFVAQFLEEARVSAGLRHGNIAQVLDFGVVEGSHYLALELVSGMDLSRLLRILHRRGETLTSGIVAYLAAELAVALEYAHTHSKGAVLHRDISPSNVLLSSAGEVKLTDFGIAKASSQSPDAAAPKTSTGTIKGKVPYMAAEYALSGRFEARSDLFSLGVLLYESLAGRRPFIGNTELDTLHRIMLGRHPPLAEMCPGAPAQLVAAIERLLRPSPDERWESAAALQDALIDVAPPPTSRRILAELVRRAATELDDVSPIDHPEGTVAITDSARTGRDPDPVPRPASPSAVTQTRLPPEPGTEHSDPGAFAATEPRDRVAPAPLHERATELRERGEARGGAGSEATVPSPDAEPAPGHIPRAIEPIARPPAGRPAIAGLVALTAIGSVALGLGIVALVGPPDRGAVGATTPGRPEVSPGPPDAMATVPDAADPSLAAGTGLAGEPGRDAGRAVLAAPVIDAGPRAAVVIGAGATPRTIGTGASSTARARDAGTAAGAAAAPGGPRRDAGARARIDAGARARIDAGGVPARADAGASAARVEPPAPERATLRVTVVPWGNVWIDGRFMGRSPIEVPVPPGSHRVGAGFDAPLVTRTVRLRPGEIEQLDLEVEAP